MIQQPRESLRGDLERRLDTAPPAVPPQVQQLVAPVSDAAPGLFHICMRGLGKGLQWAAIGALAVAAVAGIAAIFTNGGADAVTNTLSQWTRFPALGGSGITGLLATAGGLGATAGFALGTPRGCMHGVQDIRTYYSEVGLPQALGKGVEIGSALTQQAQELEAAAAQNAEMRESLVAMQNPKGFVERYQQEKAQPATVTL